MPEQGMILKWLDEKMDSILLDRYLPKVNNQQFEIWQFRRDEALAQLLETWRKASLLTIFRLLYREIEPQAVHISNSCSPRRPLARQSILGQNCCSGFIMSPTDFGFAKLISMSDESILPILPFLTFSHGLLW